MTFSVLIVIIISFFLLFIAIMSTVSESHVKMAANQKGQDPADFGVLPNDLKSLFFSGDKRPDFVPKDDRFVNLKRGFDIKLMGAAELSDDETIKSYHSSMYALKPKDFVGMMPIPKVVPAEGERVKAGDIIFFDKKRPSVKYASPVSGELLRIQRGEKRSINEVVILADKDMEYRSYDLPNLSNCGRDELITFLLESGAWPFIRQRPFNIVADHEITPKSIFVSTFDTAPLSPGYDLSVDGKEDIFQKGLDVLSKLTDGDVHLGLNANAAPHAAFSGATGVTKTWYQGAHPAGNVGIQIHHTDPVYPGHSVWHVDVYGVLVIGSIFLNGQFDTSRVVAVTGVDIDNPRYIRTHQGANIDKLVKQIKTHDSVEVQSEDGTHQVVEHQRVRLVSGNLLTGKEIQRDGYLGFFDDQLSTVEEGDYYELFGWLVPQKGHPTNKKAFPGGFTTAAYYAPDTQQNGEKRAFVVSGEYERVLPMDIYPQHLMRAIQANDFEKMEGLGIYELAEEDVALCEYVCTSKQPLQKMLREGLNELMEQG